MCSQRHQQYLKKNRIISAVDMVTLKTDFTYFTGLILTSLHFPQPSLDPASQYLPLLPGPPPSAREASHNALRTHPTQKNLGEQNHEKQWPEKRGFSHQLMIYLQASLVSLLFCRTPHTNTLQAGHFYSALFEN